MTIRMTNTLVASIAALATAGCVTGFNGPEHALSVAETHPIAVDSQIVTLTIDADDTTTDLSDMDKIRLRSFANAYMTNGHGPLTITAPSGFADRDGHEAAADIRAALNEAGVPWDRIGGATYRTGGDNGDDLILSYTHFVATPSACGDFSGIAERDARNLRAPNFGCATQNNLAAVLADPHDLVAPAAVAPRDAMASSRGVAAYRTGETTSSDAEQIEADVAEN
ncbi:MAG: CpaD family pilus assembly lipoprotein [Pseudomonadota bacterium]